MSGDRRSPDSPLGKLRQRLKLFDQGKAPFTISSNGASAETFYTVFRDLQNSKQVPLVVAHGSGGTHHYLKSRHHSIPVILYDQLGQNESFWTVEVLVQQLHDLIKYLEIENRFDFMGHSFGTALGVDLAWQPELRMGLRKLILWSPAMSVALLESSSKKQREMLPKEIRETLERHEADGTTDSQEYKKAMSAAQHINFCRLEVWPDELLERCISDSVSPVSFQLLLVFTYPYRFGNSALGMTGTIKNWSAWDTAHRIPVPTLLMNGHYDWSDDAVDPLFWALPVVKWVSFSNSSHLLHFEEKQRFMDIVSSWLVVPQSADGQ
ncbi:Alpha/Beta hydrolase protein [Mycena leptocephala]|nr:Alpha/Beta hydrolase protein [Mycena leptocephala]